MILSPQKRCGLCHEFTSHFKYSEKKTGISHFNGILKGSEQENLNLLQHHGSHSKQHTFVMGKLRERTLEELESDNYQAEVGHYHSDRFLATMNVIRIVYTGMHKPIFFESPRGL